MDHPIKPGPPYDLARAALARQVRLDTFRASGPGGQNLHKTESAVRLTHLPSGVVVLASDTRSQTRNREIAFERLAERLQRLNRRPKLRRRPVPPVAPKTPAGVEEAAFRDQASAFLASRVLSHTRATDCSRSVVLKKQFT